MLFNVNWVAPITLLLRWCLPHDHCTVFQGDESFDEQSIQKIRTLSLNTTKLQENEDALNIPNLMVEVTQEYTRCLEA